MTGYGSHQKSEAKSLEFIELAKQEDAAAAATTLSRVYLKGLFNVERDVLGAAKEKALEASAEGDPRGTSCYVCVCGRVGGRMGGVESRGRWIGGRRASLPHSLPYSVSTPVPPYSATGTRTTRTPVDTRGPVHPADLNLSTSHSLTRPTSSTNPRSVLRIRAIHAQPLGLQRLRRQRSVGRGEAERAGYGRAERAGEGVPCEHTPTPACSRTRRRTRVL